MGKSAELEKKFWTALNSDMAVMLGLVGVDESHAWPMTAQPRGAEGPIWFFTSRGSTLVRNLRCDSRAIGTFASKDHDLFASIHGGLSLGNDQDVIDGLWNPYVAAWYEDGKDDPELRLICFDAEHVEIWENANSMLAGLKMLIGIDPKRDYQDKVA